MSFIRKIKKNDKTYLAEVENQWKNGKCVQKHIRYVGKEVDGKTIISTSLQDIEVNEVKLFGPLLILNHIAKEIGLDKMFGKYSGELLSLVYAHCLDYKSINKMSKWYKRTDLNMLLNLENLTEYRLLKSLDFLNNSSIDKLQQSIFENVKLKYSIDNKGIIYDVTNTYLHGDKCKLGKLGKSKDGKNDKPLIQIGLAVTKDDGIPVFHKTFDGNISDSKTLHDLISDFKKYKMQPGILVYDKGITSKDNIKDILKNKWNTLCGLALNNSIKKIVRGLIKNNEFVKIKNRIKLNKSIFYVKPKFSQMGNF